MIRASGSVEELGSGGLPIGLFKDGSFEQGCVEMGRGDLFCAYSDGLTECLSRSDEEFGLGRLTELVASLQGRPLTDIVTTVDDAVTEFAQGQSQGDDQTIVLVRRRA
jgi:sigma-B regulation protein RsbU (phosphoserine phosphatase)